MNRLILIAFALAGTAVFSQTPGTCPGIPAGFSLGANNGTLNGFKPFPSSVLWNPVDTTAVDSRSAAWMSDFVFQQGIDLRIRTLYPSSQNGSEGKVEGFLYHVVPGTQRRVNVAWRDTGDGTSPADLDPGPYPVPLAARVKNTLDADTPVPGDDAGDGHVLVIDKDNCLLYQFFKVRHVNGGIQASTAAVFDLLSGDHQRPFLKASGSVSGLPLMPNFTLVNRDELEAGQIDHVIFGTAFVSGGGNFFPHHSFVSPASMHQYGKGGWNPNEFPLGGRVRLKSSVNTSSWPAQAQVYAAAMKKYGVIIGDGGGTMDFYGAAAPNWDVSSLAYLYSNWYAGPNSMEVPQSGAVYCDPMFTLPTNGGCPNAAPSGAAPVISAFSASTTVASPGQPVTLSWTVSGASSRIRFVSPNVGAVVSPSVVVRPSKTTTYTLTTQNQFGRSTANVTVVVGAPGQKNLYVAVRPSTVPGSTKVQLTLDNDASASTATECASSPCVLQFDPATSGTRISLQYRSAAGKTLSASFRPLPLR